jgi:hypothetical protein
MELDVRDRVRDTARIHHVPDDVVVLIKSRVER